MLGMTLLRKRPETKVKTPRRDKLLILRSVLLLAKIKCFFFAPNTSAEGMQPCVTHCLFGQATAGQFLRADNIIGR
jgi:hypothetical protein